MSVIIWGSKGFANHLGYVIQECPFCRNRSPFAVYEIGRKFTLYWIPTFSYNRKLIAECGICRGSFEVTESCREKLTAALLSQQQLSDLLSGKCPAGPSPRYDKSSPTEASVVVVEPPPKPRHDRPTNEQKAEPEEVIEKDRSPLATASSISDTPNAAPQCPQVPAEQAIVPRKPNLEAVNTQKKPESTSQMCATDNVEKASASITVKATMAESYPQSAVSLPWMVVVCLIALFCIYINYSDSPTSHKTGTSSSEDVLASLEQTPVEEKDSGSLVINEKLEASQTVPPKRPKKPPSEPREPTRSKRGTELLSYQPSLPPTLGKSFLQRSDDLTDAGNRLALARRYTEAMEKYRSAIRQDPGNYRPKCNLARILATCPDSRHRNGTKAVRYAIEAEKLVPHSDWQVWSVVAASYAEVGDFKSAIEWAKKACSVARGADFKNAEINLKKFESNLAVTW